MAIPQEEIEKAKKHIADLVKSGVEHNIPDVSKLYIIAQAEFAMSYFGFTAEETKKLIAPFNDVLVKYTPEIELALLGTLE